MKNLRLEKIVCPYCGAEYLPGEIYIPNSFVGQPTFVEREGISGKILDSAHGEMDVVEHYNCDRCKKDFKTIARVTFQSYPVNKMDFSTPHKTKIKKEQLFLSEEE